MKKILWFLFITASVLISLSLFDPLLADPPSPPSLPAGHGYGNNVPAGAPIDGGAILLLGLGAGYGVRALVKKRKFNDH
jgi:hypothetical protein